MLDLALDVGDAPARITLVPEAVELLRGGPELYDEVAGQVLWLGLPTLLAPELDQGCFVISHDDPGIRAAVWMSVTRRPVLRTEELNRFWYERKVKHSAIPWMAATLDGIVEGTEAVFEAKFMLPWSFSEEAAVLL